MLKNRNSVFIATSLDGFIADRDGGLNWLHSIANPEGDDMGYSNFMATIDALVMGRITYETVSGFDMDWPYQKPVYVLSNTLDEIPAKHKGKAHLIKGTLNKILADLGDQGFINLYIDGGTTIQNFLREDLIDEMIITTIPILLGRGISLFGDLSQSLDFRCTKTKIFLESIVQNHYLRIR